MIRKLIRLSPSTAVVSLPTAWVRTNKLTKGDPLFVQETENSLLISTSSKKTEKETTIDLCSLSGRLMWTAIDAAYVAGYDSITLLTKDAEQTAFMTKVVRYFPGMIIDEERQNKVCFKDITETARTDVSKLVNRLYFMILTLFDDGIHAVQTKNWQMLSALKKRDYTLNSYVSYCLRQMNKYGFVPLSKLGIMHSYVKVLEILSDKICALFVGIGTKKIHTNHDMLCEIHNLLRDVHKLHQSFHQKHLIILETKRKSLHESLPSPDPHVHVYMTELLELVFDLEELETQLHI